MSDDLLPGPVSFPTTQWSQIARAGRDSQEAREALSGLLQRYLPALKAHLVIQLKIDRDRADDLLQGFISDKVLQKGLLAKADRERGRFRHFLRTALRNYAIDQIRGHAHPHPQPLSPDSTPVSEEPADTFDVAWAREVIAETLRRIEAECQAAGRADIWQVFQCRVLHPILEGADPLPYDRLVEQFGLKSPTQAMNLLITAKRTFARVLRALVQEYAGEGAEIEAEIADLRKILENTRAG